MSDETSTAEPIAYELAIDVPGHAEGTEIEIPGLGLFENGSTYDITVSEAEQFQILNTRLVDAEDSDGNIIGVKSELGPTLAVASETMHGITATVVAKQ